MSAEYWVQILPAINASLNGTATVLLITGFAFIRKDPVGNKMRHRACMLGAFLVSTVFLALYLTHKALKKAVGVDINTTFAGEGFWKGIYYAILASHVLLAMIIVPLIIVTLQYALRDKLTQHRAWAKWTFPIWMYVSITGVLVYFFLYQWFPAA